MASVHNKQGNKGGLGVVNRKEPVKMQQQIHI
jgi:hypothetical protein